MIKIYKIQLPLSTNAEQPVALAYFGKDHQDVRNLVIDDALLSWFKKGEVKIYVRAKPVPGGLKIIERVRPQNW